MTDTIVHMGQNSPEYVAYRLFQDVRIVEEPPKATKKWILDTYAECLNAVRQPVNRVSARPGERQEF